MKIKAIILFFICAISLSFINEKKNVDFQITKIKIYKDFSDSYKPINPSSYYDTIRANNTPYYEFSNDSVKVFNEILKNSKVQKGEVIKYGKGIVFCKFTIVESNKSIIVPVFISDNTSFSNEVSVIFTSRKLIFNISNSNDIKWIQDLIVKLKNN